MQNRPDKPALLEALARFLATDVKAAIKDPDLAFRVLVAANIAAVVAAEILTEEPQEDAELERLRALLGEAAPKVDAGNAGRKAALEKANRALVERIERGLAPEEDRRVRDHVMLTLRGELFAQSPRFDTSLDVEDR